MGVGKALVVARMKLRYRATLMRGSIALGIASPSTVRSFILDSGFDAWWCYFKFDFCINIVF